MAIQKSYSVHSVTSEDVPVQAQVGGRTGQAKVPGLVAELAEVGGAHCPTFKFCPETDQLLADCKALFVVGNKVTVTFDKGA